MPWAGFSNAGAGVAVPDNMLAADVGTVMRCDRIKGAPSGAAWGARIVWARPGSAGAKRRLSAEAAATTRRHSSSQTRNKLRWRVRGNKKERERERRRKTKI